MLILGGEHVRPQRLLLLAQCDQGFMGRMESLAGGSLIELTNADRDAFIDFSAASWISPIYPSPMFGYDVADYCDVDPCFGTLADFDDLLTQAHGRGPKVLVDFVPNHTHRTNTLGLSRAALRKKIRKETGTSGAILPRTADHPTIGSTISAVQLGNGTR